MNLKTIFIATATVLSAQAFAVDAILFVPETYPIGEVEQGDVKHIVLKGANLTGNEVSFESVMGQGIGMSNFKYPEKVAPGGAVKVEFDMNFSNMEGEVNPVVIMVTTDGKPYTASLSGMVKTPFFFGEKMFDAGYCNPGDKREWTFYVWETDRKKRPDLVLDKASKREFSIKTKPVMLDVDKLDQIKEGGKVPGLKVTLSTKGLLREGWELKQQSVRKIVSFKSKMHPKATPEVLIIGYWN